ncbi:hypothetical protein [Nakamurella leprariae]|uniref:Uncharacterized protein n=1 Tax=Nakamurella leprariae TaxID=2803911 RepID=A0A938YF67_9ACTN|nr:hypothetical protein [Nakamurella leprariae]MBM9466683.1 hypothetical protein [Nakamurella leprariae]
MPQLSVVICAGADPGAEDGQFDELPAVTAVHRVGPRPSKQIDALLTGRVLVVGDDADLAAVVLRLLRRDRLGEVEVAYRPATTTPTTRLWRLPAGPVTATALSGLAAAPAVPVPLVRDDNGGVLLGAGRVEPVRGAAYVDEHRVLGGDARRLEVVPDAERGVRVTVVRRGRLPWTERSTVTVGRAVQLGTQPATVTRDGIEYPRPMDRWTWYRHTAPLLLVSPAGAP